MIHVNLPAAMECVAKDCGARLGVKLAMTMGGTLLPRPPTGHGWQISLDPSNGVFVCRCPLHHALIDRLSNSDPSIIEVKH